MKILLAVVAGLITVSAVALLVLFNLDGNRVKPRLNALASEALGRPFSITGDLSLTWGRESSGSTKLDETWRGMIPWPHFVAQEIHIGNPPEAIGPAAVATSLSAVAPRADAVKSEIEMASIKQLAFSLNPIALFEKKISIPLLVLDSPVIKLLRRADGKDNWTFKSGDKASAWQMDLQGVIVAKGSVHLIDFVKHADVTADIDTIDSAPASGAPTYGVAWRIRGKFNGAPVSGSGKAGAVLSLNNRTLPYPIKAGLRIGHTMIAVDGTLTKPTDLVAFDMQLKVSGVNMGQLYELSGIYLPETPPFATEGHLVGTLSPLGVHWIYEKFKGKVGSSDISGTLDYRSKQPRPLLSGTVVSHLLQLSDLASVIGADSNASKATRGAVVMQPATKVLPVEPFKTERWTSIDADIKFRAEKIIHAKTLPINKLTLNLHLQGGVLSLLPLKFDMAGGALSSNITLDGSGKAGKDAIKAKAKVTARRLKLTELFPTLQPVQASVGEINGDASLSAVGNSVASLLASSNGEIKALINQGTLSKLLLEEIGLNIGNVILTSLGGDKQVKLNCMVIDFGVTNGLMHTQTFIIDTEAAILNVSGDIDLAQEKLNLNIKPNSKALRVLSLTAPLYVRGSFKQPRISIDRGVLAMKLGGAIALAALTPFAALIPLTNSGTGQDSECAKLLDASRVKPVAPPPGKTSDRKAKRNVK